MNEGNNALLPRTGFVSKLIEGPKAGGSQRSLYQQRVLDEDTYTDALSHIITRDFFPHLSHLHATNDYLTALTENDPELLSASIRRLAAIAREKESGQRGSTGRSVDDIDAERARRAEFVNAGTPYIALPGARGRPIRTPVGARGWETPTASVRGSTRRRNNYDDFDELNGPPLGAGGETPAAGPSQPRKRHKTTAQVLRDDLSLDDFQRNYTSEDNASFVQIVDEENKKRREERWGWAWEAERRAEIRRIEGEEKRKMILDAATSGHWRVNADGQRLIGGLAEGGKDRADGEAWKDIKLIEATDKEGEAEENEKDVPDKDDQALVSHSSNSAALVRTKDIASASTLEAPLPPNHPLTKALVNAGLPGTALVSHDGAVVPHRELASGSGQGRGRGSEDIEQRKAVEKATMGEEQREVLSLSGSGADMWGYKTRNNLMFPADSNSAPYPPAIKISTASASSSAAPPTIAHANTRLPDEEDGVVGGSGSRSSRRGSSPARSWVDAAVKGTPYRRESDMPTINHYPLMPNDPSPSPEDMPALLTWGTLLATPRALDGSATSADPLEMGRSFKLPETKRRDEIGRKLADKASRSMNDRAKGFTPRPSGLAGVLRSAADRTQRSDRGDKNRTPGTMLPPSTPGRRADTLTPAARKLLERSVGRSPMTSSGHSGLGTSGRNRGAAMEKGSGWSNLGGRKTGGMSWTPSPRR